MTDDSRIRSLERSHYLEGKAQEYIEDRKLVHSGIERDSNIKQLAKKIRTMLGATKKEWNDWHWQMANRISDMDTLQKCLDYVPELFQRGIVSAGKTYRWGVSPYYLSLSDPGRGEKCPVSLMSLPIEKEFHLSGGELDPMKEEFTNPCGSIVRRYPDRVIINCTNICASYCRFCQRRRLIGKRDVPVSRQKLLDSIEFIRSNSGLRDILITGGDPLTLEDDVIGWLLNQISSIPHVEIIRIGTRVLVTLPQRITPSLCKLLKKHKTVYINTHFNHPSEVTKSSMRAAQRLADSGIPLGNQSVLLAGVNNSHIILKHLFHLLLMMRIKPYYLFHPKQVRGTLHFYCSISEGLDIVRQLRGFTSGMAIPTYVLNTSGGLGKIPIMPEYVVPVLQDEYLITTWEGRKIIYKENKG